MPLSRLIFFLCLSLFAFRNACADEYEIISKNGKFGLKNITSGEILISPQYESIGWSDGTSQVKNNVIGARQNEKWALINLDGSKISAHEFSVLSPFLNNSFIVSKRNKNSILTSYGLINSRAKFIIEPIYGSIKAADGLLIASKQTGGIYQFGLLNIAGKPIISFEHNYIELIETGFFSVRNDEALAALYTKEGLQLTSFQFETIESLNDNLFLVKFYNKRGLIDKKGKLVVSPIYKNIQLSGNKVRALAFTKWDLYQHDGFERSFYFDQMTMINQNTFAVTSEYKTGVIDGDERYKEYISNIKTITSVKGLTTIADSQSKYQGVMNDSGEIVIPTIYDSVAILGDLLFCQLRRVDKQDWIVFNQSGKKQNAINLETFRVLPNGFFLAVRNGKKGLLQNNGQDGSPFIYDSIGEFKNELAIASFNGGYGVINTEGEWIITPYNDQIEILDNVVKIKQGSEWKLVSLQGNEMTRSYDTLNALPKGYNVRVEDGFQLYNAANDLLLDHTYDTIQVIHDDLYSLRRDGLHFLFKPSSQFDIALDSGIVKFGELSEGLIPVLKDNRWGQIDDLGNLRIANRYENIQPFSENLAGAQLIGRWGFIDKNEDLIVQPIYDEVSPFKDGLSIVKRNSKYGIINTLGKLVLSIDFTSINRQKDYIILNSNGIFGLADSRGKVIRSPQYDRIMALDNNHFLIERDGLKGVVNLKGQDAIPLSYTSIKQLGNSFLASEPSYWKLINLQ